MEAIHGINCTEPIKSIAVDHYPKLGTQLEKIENCDDDGKDKVNDDCHAQTNIPDVAASRVFL